MILQDDRVFLPHGGARLMQDSDTQRIIKINPLEPEYELLKKAVETLEAGNTIVFPTDTVYGIGVAVLEHASPAQLMTLKHRSQNKSIPLLIGKLEELEVYGAQLPPYAFELARKHWPGALTLVVQASNKLSQQFIHADGSIALRMPAHPISLELLTLLKVPLATSSANISGLEPARSSKELDPALLKAVSLVIDGGKLNNIAPSTVVSCLEHEPRVLRKGPVTIGVMGE